MKYGNTELRQSSGVYILCFPNSNYYVGSSKNIAQRINNHFRDFANLSSHNARINNCVNKYGNPKVKVKYCTDYKETEQYIIDTYYDRLLNISLVFQT